MDKLTMMSKDNVQANIEKIKALFPNAVTEVIRDGKPTLAVDFDVLKQEMSSILIDDKEERYQFTWPDKKKSILLANSPISAALRPCKEESVDFDNTENLYIEGDNLDVLKLLQETYLHAVDIIYIDPPYNTGNNLIYKNNFAQSQGTFSILNNDIDDEGNRLVKNLETNGRFHTDWLNMIYPRLLLARNLLKEKGVLIVTIDQSEVNTLGVILKELFSNKTITCVSIVHNPSGTQGNNFAFNNEFAFFVYDDTIRNIELEKRTQENADIRSFMNGAKGDTDNYLRGSGANTFYPIIVKEDKIIGFGDVCPDDYHPEFSNITNEDGTISIYPKDSDGVERKWLFERGTVESIIDELHVKKASNGLLEIIRVKDEINYKTIWNDKKYNAKQYGTILLKELMGQTVFSNPKSLYAVEESIKACVHSKNDAVILDFFSGSSTTAHAVMQLNTNDGGKRKFIMVQLPENLDENLKTATQSEKKTIINAINMCEKLERPHTIAEIAKERIRRAGKKIKEENPNTNIDTGFRVLKLDSSNMKDVYYKAGAYSQDLLSSLEDNIKEDRTPLDLLFQVMLDLGKPLSAKIEEIDIGSKKIFKVDGNDLVACFDILITEEIVKTIAQMKPLYAVFRDNSFANDTVATNFDQIFATYSPNTTRKVL